MALQAATLAHRDGPPVDAAVASSLNMRVRPARRSNSVTMLAPGSPRCRPMCSFQSGPIMASASTSQRKSSGRARGFSASVGTSPEYPSMTFAAPESPRR